MVQDKSDDDRLCKIVDQYDVYARDLGNIGTLQSHTNTRYVSIVTALLVYLSLAGEGRLLGQIRQVAQLTVAVLGILLCFTWWLQVRSFRILYKAKYQVLREMEKMKDQLLFPCFTRQTELLGLDTTTAPKTSKPRYQLLNVIEGYAVLLLMIPFLVMLIYSVVTWITA